MSQFSGLSPTPTVTVPVPTPTPWSKRQPGGFLHRDGQNCEKLYGKTGIVAPYDHTSVS
jgi:hypothetical protein